MYLFNPLSITSMFFVSQTPNAFTLFEFNSKGLDLTLISSLLLSLLLYFVIIFLPTVFSILPLVNMFKDCLLTLKACHLIFGISPLDLP